MPISSPVPYPAQTHNTAGPVPKLCPDLPIIERFGLRIGLLDVRVPRILDRYMMLPESAVGLVGRSFLGDKARRHYLRIVNEGIARFTRTSD